MSLYEKALKHAEDCLKVGHAFMYADESKEKRVSQNGLDFVLHYRNGRKSEGRNVVEDHQKSGTPDPLLPPYPLYKEVMHLEDGAGHYLFVNRYQVAKGHIVISSDDPKDRQTDSLTQRDFIALSKVIHGYDCKGIAFFNCNTGSGCSQMHKHMQFAPLTYNPLFEAMVNGKELPYKYFTTRLDDYEPNTLKDAYEYLMDKASTPSHYNFIISSNCAALVPRVRGTHENGVGVNSLGVSGHLFIFDSDEKIVTKNIIRMISDLCVPISNSEKC